VGNAVREANAYFSLSRFEDQRSRTLAAREEVVVSHDCLRGSRLHWSPFANQHFYGRGAGVGRTREVGVALGVAVAVGVGVGVGEPDCAQYLPPVLK
jgi:hypothetical protein